MTVNPYEQRLKMEERAGVSRFSPSPRDPRFYARGPPPCRLSRPTCQSEHKPAEAIPQGASPNGDMPTSLLLRPVQELRSKEIDSLFPEEPVSTTAGLRAVRHVAAKHNAHLA